MVVRRGRVFAMSHTARAFVALLTVLSVACTGSTCGRSRAPTVTQATGGAVVEGTPADGLGARSSVAGLRAPIVQAGQDALRGLGLNVDSGTLTPEDVGRLVERTMSDVAAAQAAQSRDSFDLAALIKKVGANRDRLFEWVRDNTSLVAYRGVLRGATGVLMDRRGNSLDRALLLGELLRSSGISIRLARTTLSTEQAATLLSGIRPTSLQVASDMELERVAADDIRTYAARNGLDVDRVRQSVERLAASSMELGRLFDQRVRTQAAAIEKAVEHRTAASASGDDQVDSLRDHWWIQYQEGAEWIDLDLTPPGSTNKQDAGGASETMALTGVPDELYHQLTIRVIIERQEASGLREATALSHSIRPMDLFGQRLMLRHRPLQWPGPLDSNAFKTSLDRAVLAQKEWQPVLIVGGKPIAQSSFTEIGVVNERPGARQLGGTGFGGLLGGGLGGEDVPAETGVLTAEWIEYEVRTPARAPRIVRRDIFDVLGPAARARTLGAPVAVTDKFRLDRGLKLLGETEILPLVAQPSREFVEHVIRANVLNQHEPLQAFIRAGATESPERVAELASKLAPAPSELYGFAFARDAMSPVKDRLYIDQINILNYHRTFRSASGGIARTNSLDIVTNDYGTQPGAGAFQVLLTQGVVDTVAETLFVGGCASCGPSANVSELWSASHASGDSWVAIRAIDDAAWSQVNVGDDIRVRIQQELKAGYNVLVPSKAVSLAGQSHVGWWRVDPRSGNTLGVMESGQGQAAVEYRFVAGMFAAGFVGMLAYYDCTGGLTHKNPGIMVACGACAVIAGAGAFTLVFSYGTIIPAAKAKMVLRGAVLWGLSNAISCSIAGLMA